MRESKRCVLVIALTVSAMCAATVSSSAQIQHHMQTTLEAPKAIVTPTVDWPAKSIAYIKASNTTAASQFGWAVTLSADGNTMAVGATGEQGAAKGINGVSKGMAADSGAVYVYARDPKGGWKQQAYVKSSNSREGAEFGHALSLSGDGNLLAVSSTGEGSSATGVNGNQDDNSMPGAGAVYVFARTGDKWTQQAYVKSSNTGGPQIGYQFGYAVSLSSDGGTMAVSETSDPSNANGVNGNQKLVGAPDSGAVFIFSHSGGSNWTQEAYLKPWNTTTRGVLFGYSVGLSGDGNTAAVGTYDEDGGRGAVYVFTRDKGKWAQQMRLVTSNAEDGDSLGCSIGISDDGNTIVSGAFDEDAILPGIQPPDAGAHDEEDDASAGAAYVFVRSNGKWSQQAYMKAFNTRLNDQFGWALAISRDGNTIAVGSHLEDSGAKGINGDEKDFSAEDSGAVYVYKRIGETWSPAAYVKASNPKKGAEFGISVALNGDGNVLAAGAMREDSTAKGVNGKQTPGTATNAGAAYIYY